MNCMNGLIDHIDFHIFLKGNIIYFTIENGNEYRKGWVKWKQKQFYLNIK